MTREELRETTSYKETVDKIKGYSIGFEFTLNYAAMPTGQGNALKIVTQDLVKEGILECIETGLDVNLELCEEKFRRIGA